MFVTHDGDDVELPGDVGHEVAVPAPVPDLAAVVHIPPREARELKLHPLKGQLERVFLDPSQSGSYLSVIVLCIGYVLGFDLQSLIESHKNTLDWSGLDKLCH